MGITFVTAICALIGSVILLIDHTTRSYAVVALIVSGTELAIAQGLVKLQIVGISLGMVLPALLLILGVLMLLRVHNKSRVAAATVILMSGAIHLGVVLKLI